MPLTELTGKIRDKRCKFKDGPFGRRYYSILYAIECPLAAKVKIGRTIDIAKRFGALSTMHAVPLVLRGHVWLPDDAETLAHEFLAKYRSHGEWFHFSQTVKEFVALIAAQRVPELASALDMDGLLVQPTPKFYEPPVYRRSVSIP